MNKQIQDIIDLESSETLHTVGSEIIGGCLPKNCN